MNGLIIKIFQEGLRHFPTYPVGDGDDGQSVLRHGCERLLLVFPVAGGAVQQPACREFMFLWAMVAAGLPAGASGKVVMIAMPRVQPAVVDGPYDLYIAVAQVIKENLVVQEIAVDIVNMHNVGADFINPLYELLRGLGRGQSVPVEQSGLNRMPGNAETVTHRHRDRRGMHEPVSAPAIGHIALPAIRHSQFADFFHYPPGGGVCPHHGIYLEEFLHISPS